MPRWLAPAAILVVTIVAYLPAMKAGYIWDDDFHVTENPLLWSPNGLLFMWFKPYELPQYYPMTHTTFWVEYQLWQQHPLGYHVNNVLLHAANAILLGLLLRRLDVSAAWWVAALFAAHPVHVESVAWISERKNVLSGFFYLLAFLAYERFLTWGDDHPSRWRWYGLALLLFVLSLFSKTVTSTLPGALLVTIWWKRGRITWKEILPTLPLFALGLVMGAVTAHIEHVKLTGGAPEFDLSPAERFLIAGRVAWFYAWKLVLPLNLSFVYHRWDVDAGQLWQYAFSAAAILALLGAWVLRSRAGRGMLAAMLLFGGTLMPALGFVNVWPMRFSYVADHFQYLASIGLLLLVGAAASQLIRPVQVRAALLSLIVLLLSGATFVRATVFESAEKLWSDTLENNPGAWLAHGQLARIAKAKGEMARAAEHYEQTLSRKPMADVYVEYGVMLLEGNEFSKARAQFLAATAMEPNHVVAHNLAGVSWAQQEKWQEAKEEFEAAVAADPAFADAHVNLGRVLEQMGNAERAKDHYRQALRAVPNHAGAAAHLARMSATR